MQTPQITYEQALAIWQSIPESSEWPAATAFERCRERPDLIWPRSIETGEVFSIVNVMTGQVVSEDEFSSRDAENCSWDSLQANA